MFSISSAKKLNKRVRAFDALSDLRIKMRNQSRAKGQTQPLPSNPLSRPLQRKSHGGCDSPSSSDSPVRKYMLGCHPVPGQIADMQQVCTGTRLSTRQGLRVFRLAAGSPALCTGSYLQFICD
ncbi:hypothetical protein B2J93_1872 [Marssonina coronariae]|uniref:Uncharacterized protein n=1 Tax=Diplocarpon coronariae TaxID=2795749 RepID=A0A218ZFR3_9HELO|nr:hypothetical protein B2J93_1872 [Marssonina coronariae]